MAEGTAYLVPMIIVLIILVAALAFATYYYLAQLKPRLDQMVFDKMSGVIGIKDASGAMLLLKPPTANTQESSHIQLKNPPAKAGYDFDMFTTPIAGNTKGQVNMNFVSAQGSGYRLPMTM